MFKKYLFDEIGVVLTLSDHGSDMKSSIENSIYEYRSKRQVDRRADLINSKTWQEICRTECLENRPGLSNTEDETQKGDLHSM